MDYENRQMTPKAQQPKETSTKDKCETAKKLGRRGEYTTRDMTPARVRKPYETR